MGVDDAVIYLLQCAHPCQDGDGGSVRIMNHVPVVSFQSDMPEVPQLAPTNVKAQQLYSEGHIL